MPRTAAESPDTLTGESPSVEDDAWAGVPRDQTRYGEHRDPQDPRALPGKRGIATTFRRVGHHLRWSFGHWSYRVAGTPAGGVYSPDYHWTPDREVTEAEAHENDHATFDQPPYPMSAVQVVDFWDNVEVPHEVVAEVAEAHRLSPSTARMVVRCWNMRLSATRLSPPESAKLRSYGVRFPNGATFRPEDALDFHLDFGQRPSAAAGPAGWGRLE